MIEHWAFTYYDQQEHPALQMSPKAAFDLGLVNTGARPHRAIVFNRDFLIATCPSPDRGGMRKVDRQRGVKVNNFYYQSPVFDSMGVAAKGCLSAMTPTMYPVSSFSCPTDSGSKRAACSYSTYRA